MLALARRKQSAASSRDETVTSESQWISVAERLPDDDDREPVLALRANELDEDLRLVVADAGDVRAEPISFTYWMPIPALPV